MDKNIDDKVEVINGLRGLAILMVIYHHLLAEWLKRILNFNFIIGNAWIGVNLFFVLSGFVLYKPYTLNKRNFNTFSDWLTFYKHRFWRLYPLFSFSLVVYLLVKGVSYKNIESALFSITTFSMFTTTNFLPAINNVLWSLVVEIWFSIIFPLVVLSISRFGLKRVVLVTCSIALLSRFPGVNMEYINPYLNPWKDHFIGRIDDFILGFVICHQYYHNKGLSKFGFTKLFLAIFFIGAGMVLWDLIVYRDLNLYVIPFTNILFLIGFYFLITYLLTSKSVFEKIISSWPMQLLGVMCYSLYLWHDLFLNIFKSEKNLINLIYYFLLVFMISALSYRFIEFRKKRFRELFLFE